MAFLKQRDVFMERYEGCLKSEKNMQNVQIKCVTVQIMLFNNGEFMEVCSIQILTEVRFLKGCSVPHERRENRKGEVDDDG